MAGTNRTKILQEVVEDVTTLKKEFVEQRNKIEHMASWIKDNWKPTLDEIKVKFGTEIESLKEGIDTSNKMGKNLANWVKDNLGTKLEKLNDMISTEVAKQISVREKQLRDEQKETNKFLYYEKLGKFNQISKRREMRHYGKSSMQKILNNNKP